MLARLPDVPNGEILVSWERLARPVALRRDPGDPLNRPPASPPDGTAIVHDEAGAPYLLFPAPPATAPDEGWRLTPGRGDWQVLVPPTATRGWPHSWWRVHRADIPHDAGRVRYDGVRVWGISRRTDEPFRSGPHAEVLVRALLVRGLMEDGLSHAAAVRQWLAWDRACGSTLTRRVEPEILAAANRIAARGRGTRYLPQSERDARTNDRGTWGTWEHSLARQHHRLWRDIGIVGPGGRPTATIFAYR